METVEERVEDVHLIKEVTEMTRQAIDHNVELERKSDRDSVRIQMQIWVDGSGKGPGRTTWV